MTINEKSQLSEYIKGLVRESVGEMYGDSFRSSAAKPYGVSDEEYFGDEWQDELSDDEDTDEYPVIDDPKPGDEAELDANPNWKPKSDWPMKGSTAKDDPIDDDDEIAGLNELRKLCEGMAREAVSNMLTEKKGGKGWKNHKKGSKKRKNKKEKTSSKDKTVISKLNADGTNAAHYFYKLYGVENGTEAEKAAARSKGYKKAKGKKNDTGVPYKFTSKERNRLGSLLTDR